MTTFVRMTPREPSPDRRERPANDRTLASQHAPHFGAARVVDGQMIGNYRIVRLIGAGGMGRVYEAQQENPRRTVAIKLMSKGVASASALGRFEFESQVLARLKHPGIAQIHEAGSYDDGEGGLPWFAMEYISNAKPITEYARDARLGTRERMQLFRQACEAVAHGHQRGVIHRDLKPTNILVDGAGNVKVIDFGVAKTTDSDMAVNTLRTDVGQLVGTVQYMSPEQFDADPHDLDIRSDVYALGVVLYELLSGRLPYELRKKPIHEAARVVREEDAPRLSTIAPALRGDLEVIVAKAMAKPRGQRYDSASALSEDIRRYLDQEPITARAPGVVETMRRFGRRHRVVSAAILAAFAVLSVSVVVVSALYLDLQRKSSEIAQKNDSLAFEQTLTEKALRDAQQARTHSDEALGRLQAETYVSAIRRGTGAMADGRTDIVSQELQAIAGLRMPGTSDRFEWRMLQAAAHPELLVVRAHAGDVTALAFTPDARTLASAGADGAVRLWNADSGAPITELKGHAGRVNALSCASDGGLLASAGDDAVVRLWDPRTMPAAQLGALKGHTQSVRAVAFSPDGQTLATGSADRTVKLWNARTHACARTLEGHTKAVRAVLWTPDGSTLITASGDGDVRVWDAATGACVRTLTGHPGEITSLALSSDARAVAAGFADGTVELWNPGDGARLASTRLDGAPTSLAFAPAGASTQLLATTAAGVSRIDAATGNLLGAPSGEPMPLTAVTFSPDGARYATGGNDGLLRMWSAESDHGIERLTGLPSAVHTLAFPSSTGSTLAFDGAAGSVQLWDTAGSPQPASLTQGTDAASAIAFTPDGNLLATATREGALRVWDARAGTVRTTLETSGSPINAIAFSPDGRTIASAGADQLVRLWDVASGKVFAQLSGHAGGVRCVAFAPSGSWIASGSDDGAIRLWDAATRTFVASLPGHDAAVRSLAFAPDGASLVSGSDDRTVRVWDLASRTQRHSMQGHGGEIACVAFDPSGRTVASGSGDATVRLWDAASGKELAALTPRIGGVNALAFMHDGTTLACGGASRSIALYRAEPASIVVPRRAAARRAP